MIAPNLGPTELSVRHGIKKRKRSPVPVEKEPQSSKSRKACGQIEVQLERRAQYAGPRDSAASRGSRGPIAQNSCDHGSSRVKELEEQLSMALRAKEDLVAEAKEHKTNATQSTLKHLEEYFTCPL